jgi:hypothetical protein
VREPILSSWRRSRLRHVPSDRLEVPFDTDLDPDTVLTRAADLVLGDLLDHLLSEPVSVLLCNARGTVLRRHTGDRLLEEHLDRICLGSGLQLRRGARRDERHRHRLETQGPAQVFGHEHYAEHLEGLACAGIPIVSPVTGKLHGVLDLTCWRRDAGRTLSSGGGVRLPPDRRGAGRAVQPTRARAAPRLPGHVPVATTARSSPSDTTCSCSTTGLASSSDQVTRRRCWPRRSMRCPEAAGSSSSTCRAASPPGWCAARAPGTVRTVC